MVRFRQRGGNILPQLDFGQIRQPVRPRPIEEFGALTNRLRQDFETGLQETGDLTARVAALQSSPLDADREFAQRLQGDLMDRLDLIKESGDFENQVTNVRGLARDFAQQAIPITQRRQQFDEFVQNVANAKNISDRGRVIEAAKSILGQDPNVIESDGRRIFGNLDTERLAGLLSPDVNIRDTLSTAVREGVLQRLRSKDPSITSIGADETGRMFFLKEGKRQYIDRNQVEDLIASELESNPQIQGFIDRERQIGQALGEEDTIDDRVQRASDSVVNALSGTVQNVDNLSQLRLPSTDNSSSTGSNLNGIISSSRSTATPISVPEMYRNVSSQIKQLEAAGDIEAANELRDWKDSRSSADITGHKSVDEIFNKATKKIEETNEKISPISRDYRVFRGDRTGKNTSGVGVVNGLLKDGIASDNISMITSFTKNDKLQLNDVLTRKYVENPIKIDGQEITYRDFDPRQTSGISIDGFPIIEVATYHF